MGITKESKEILKRLYEIYQKRRKKNIPRSKAMRMGSSVALQQKIFPSIHQDTLDDIFLELYNTGYIQYKQYGNSIESICLTHKTLVWKENIPTKNIESLVQFISNFI